MRRYLTLWLIILLVAGISTPAAAQQSVVSMGRTTTGTTVPIKVSADGTLATSGGGGGGAGGTTQDDDDASIAAGQNADFVLNANMIFDGTVWRRLTLGTAGTASAQVMTIQGIASMTPLQVADNGGSLTIDGTVTADLGATDNAVLDAIAASVAGTLTVGSHAVTNAGTFAVQVDGAALTALQLIDNLVQAEDAVAGSGWAGVGFLAVRQDSHVDLAADGDFIPPTIDADGGLRVSIVAGAGTGGIAMADDADFTAGTTSFTPMGGFYQSTVTACTDGDTCAAGITTGRALKVHFTDAAGASLSIASDQTLDAAIGTTGPLLTGRGSTATPTAMSANGDATAIWLDLNGRLHLVTEGVEDDAETAGAFLDRVGTVRRDTAASSAGTTGDNATLNTDGLGRVWTRSGDPCSDHARITTAAIDTASSGNVEIVALNGSDLIYVCGVSLIADAALDAQLIYGTGTACATGETNLTGPYGLAANGGIALANGGKPNFVVPAGNAFCVELGGAVQLSGHVSYVRTAAP